ncbi:OmpA family protein [Verrucomicrobium sp. GAS474]|uniref:OmpA family protein n=1 Tax=Verrucomicrobium sp. GAS474 TaxID=1882831 RepID=UPI00087B2771|nr:OmpA family protein [Verrucomicrobium sp. GAS474]SDU02536.1 OmpA family protein [Verrucomicrobium sp. GAS474]
MQSRFNQRIRPSHLDAEEENYFISLSDLMVGLLFIFLILFTFFALRMSVFQLQNSDLKGINETLNAKQVALQEEVAKLEKTRQENLLAQQQIVIAQGQITTAQQQLTAIQEKLAASQESIRQLRTAQDILTNSDRIRAELLRKIQSEAAKKNIVIQVDEERGVLHLPNELLFDVGQAVLKPKGEDVIRQVSTIIKTILQNSPVTSRLDSIYIEGHTDNQPIHTPEFPDNWYLSTARALTTYRTIIATEPDLGKLLSSHDQSLLGISGYGEYRPIGDNNAEDGRKLNRRIDIRFVLAAPKFFAMPPISLPGSPAAPSASGGTGGSANPGSPGGSGPAAPPLPPQGAIETGNGSATTASLPSGNGATGNP